MASFPITGFLVFKVSFYVLLILSSINFFRNKSWPTKQTLIILLSYFIIDFLSSLIGLNIIKSPEILIRKSLFFLLPISMYLVSNHIERKIINRIMLVFLCSNAALSANVLINLFLLDFSHLWDKNSFYQPVFRNNYLKFTGIYFPYLGLYFAFSFIAAIFFFIRPIKKLYLKILALIVAVLFFVFPMLLFSPRAAFLALIIGLLFYLFKTPRNKTLTLIIASWSLLFLIFIPSPLNERIEKLINTEWVLPSNKQAPHEINFRYGVYYCATQELKNKFPFGYGLGNVQNQLDKCYKSYTYDDFNSFVEQEYNAHNQFLHEILKNGLLGLIAIFLLFYASFKGSGLVHQIFLIMCLVVLLTENFFEREAGIIFFTFINSIFIFSQSSIKK